MFKNKNLSDDIINKIKEETKRKLMERIEKELLDKLINDIDNKKSHFNNILLDIQIKFEEEVLNLIHANERARHEEQLLEDKIKLLSDYLNQIKSD